jgi:hypothetical protein
MMEESDGLWVPWTQKSWSKTLSLAKVYKLRAATKCRCCNKRLRLTTKQGGSVLRLLWPRQWLHEFVNHQTSRSLHGTLIVVWLIFALLLHLIPQLTYQYFALHISHSTLLWTSCLSSFVSYLSKLSSLGELQKTLIVAKEGQLTLIHNRF